MAHCTWKFDEQHASATAACTKPQIMVFLNDEVSMSLSPADPVTLEMLQVPGGIDFLTDPMPDAFSQFGLHATLQEFDSKNTEKWGGVLRKGVAELSKEACTETALYGSWSLAEPFKWPVGDCAPNDRGYLKIMLDGYLSQSVS